MRSFLKISEYKVLSLLPGSSRLYAAVQEHVTKSVRATRTRVAQKIQVGLEYWDYLQRQQRGARLLEGDCLDVGAGWHQTIPLLFYSLGAQRQVLVDVNQLTDAGKIADSVRLFREVVEAPDWPRRGELRRLPAMPAAHARSPAEILQGLGMEYRAPYRGPLDERKEAFDVVFCTQVLQHIGEAGQQALFRELFAALKPGGLFLATIHLSGQFYGQCRVDQQYHHLAFSPWVWEHLINSSLMQFNRLKPSDYRRNLEQAGFRLRDFMVEAPTAQDLAVLRRTKIHPAFAHYAEADLGARHLFFVAEKP